MTPDAPKVRSRVDVAFEQGDAGPCAAARAALIVGRRLASQLGVTVRVIRLTGRDAEGVAHALESLLGADPPAACVIGHSVLGAEIAARLAVRLGVACIAGVSDAEAGAEGPTYWRTVGGGRRRERVQPLTPWAVGLVLPGAGDGDGGAEAAGGALEVHTLLRAEGSGRCVVEGLSENPGEPDLARAPIVVAVGRGVGGTEGLAPVEALVRALPGAALAGSRVACDRGWLPHARQVGVTGATVSPRLYLALGISGAPQHVAGMSDSQWVVSVDPDPRAPFTRAADLVIRDDLHAFVPALLDALDSTEPHVD